MNEPTFRIQMAAEISGVKEGLIRAWERRYGVLKPARSPGGYRTYTQADIEVLKRLKRLTEEGVAIAEAVKLLPSIRREARDVEEHPAPRSKGPREEQLKAWKTMKALERTVRALQEASVQSISLAKQPKNGATGPAVDEAAVR